MSTDQSDRSPINWPTVLFISGSTAAALAWPFYAWHAGVTTAQVLLALAYFVVTGMAITVGYHRLVTHRSFRAHPVAEAILLFAGSAAWQGSALEWALDHVQHHSHIDTDKDPYNRRRGFFYAHMGWLFRRESPTNYQRIPHFLKSDRLVMLQHRIYVPLAILTSLVIPFALCGWGGLLLVGAVRIVVTHHTTWFINSWAHTGKQRPYNPDVTAADNWFLALLTFGEGFHNYHHTFPNDYRNGIHALAWDPSKWTIWLLSKIGAATDLKRMSADVIWERRIKAIEAFEGCQQTRAELVESTRRRLEHLARRSEAKARAHIVALQTVVQDHRSTAAIDLADARQRLSARVEEWRRARDERSLARAQRVEELIEQLTMYRGLLARLS